MPAKRNGRIGQTGIERVCMDRAVREAGDGMTAHHCHAFFELYYVEQGSCRFMIDDGIYELRQGDFILIPPQTFHYTRYLEDRCIRCDVYFRAGDIGESARSFLPENTAFFSHARIFRVVGRQQVQFEALFSRMAAEELRCDRQTPAMQYLHLQELFLLIARLCTFTQQVQPKELQIADRQTLLAARFISANYMHPITSADIAAAAGFSPNYLSRKFRENAGMGVHEYLVFTRLQHAAMELISTDDSITQIALRCGFSDSNYFKDAFKKKFGMTPRDYRKSH